MRMLLQLSLMLLGYAYAVYGFSIEQLREQIDDSGIYHDLEVLKRKEAGKKSGPPSAAWYYIMGHRKQSKRGGLSSQFLTKGFLPRSEDKARGVEKSRDVTGEKLMAEFMTFMFLKEQGLLNRCLGRET